MRALLTTTVVLFIAGCAAAPAGEKIAVYDHKSNTTHYVYRSTDSDFVGTSAKASNAANAQPSWYRFGHP